MVLSSFKEEGLIAILVRKGWCFRENDHIKQVISRKIALTDTIDSIESELMNMDFRDIGGKSLPDPNTIRKSSYIKGPMILQISSARDISRSTAFDVSSNSNHNRLMRFTLTDGFTEVKAVELFPIPSVSSDVVPGTKVLLENKVMVRNGILCVNYKTFTLLGGVVPTLFEEWELSKKYAGFSHHSFSSSANKEAGGPPGFEKLQTGFSTPGSIQSEESAQEVTGSMSSKNAVRNVNHDRKEQESYHSDEKGVHNGMNNKPIPIAAVEEIPHNSGTKLKELAEVIPVQNQAASQKLLHKMTQPLRGGRGFKGRGGRRGKSRQESQWESSTYTLEEWEKNKTNFTTFGGNSDPYVSADESLARQLQHQFDLEDTTHEEDTIHENKAEQIRSSMFIFEKKDDSSSSRNREFGGRGRRRGRGRRMF